MDLVLVPVVNGIFPRPDGGTIKGAFLDQSMATFLKELPKGYPLFLCPYSVDRGGFFPVGVISEIGKIWTQNMFFPMGTMKKVTFCEVKGKTRAKTSSLRVEDGKIVAEDLRTLDLEDLRSNGYPVIEGAGWQVMGGHTETRDVRDIRVTVYGQNLETGERLGIQGNVGEIVSAQQAHSIEHGIIRSLAQYGLCTPKTLVESLQLETKELRRSVEAGFRWGRPEIFGVTSSGACGNPLTNLAHFYMEREVYRRLSEGEGIFRSIDEARRKTLSQLTDDLNISTSRALTSLQGLNRGMLHDDTSQEPGKMKSVLARFPGSPWD